MFLTGQSGIGKSYSLYGKRKSQVIIQLLFKDLFDYLKNVPEAKVFMQCVDFLDTTNDLTSIDIDNSLSKAKKIHEHIMSNNLSNSIVNPRGSNFSYVMITDYHDACSTLKSAIKNRAVMKMPLNNESSRAHLFIRIDIYLRSTHPPTSLDIFDIAGNEHFDSSPRAQETALINKNNNDFHLMLMKASENNVSRFPKSLFNDFVTPYFQKNSVWKCLIIAHLEINNVNEGSTKFIIQNVYSLIKTRDRTIRRQSL